MISSRLKILFLTFLILSSTLTLLPSINCATNGGTLICGYFGFETVHPLNPLAATFQSDFAVLSMVYDSLVQYDKDLNLIAGLAYQWYVSSDGLNYTFKLFDNVSWSDGVAFTSNDVKFTFKVMIEQSVFWAWNFAPIAVYNESSPTGLSFDPSAIVLPDNYTVTFLLSYPYAPFMSYLASQAIIPQHVYDGYDDLYTNDAIFNENHVGTGPFIYSENVRGDHITLTANDRYHLGRPHVDKIVIKAFSNMITEEIALRKGEINVIEGIPPWDVPSLSSAVPIKVATSPWCKYDYIGLNLNEAHLSNKLVRQAIATAIDLEEISKVVYYGYATTANQPIPPAMVIDNVDYYNHSIPNPAFPYNQSYAKQLLTLAGYEGSPRFEVRLYTVSGNEIWSRIAQIVKQRLSDIGINVEITSYESATYNDKIFNKKDFDMYIGGWGFIPPDPDNIYYLFHSQGFYNNVGYNNSQVDDLLTTGQSEVDPTTRAQIYKNASSIIAEDLPYIFIAYPMYICAWRGVDGISPNKAQGISYGIMSGYNLRNAYLTQESSWWQSSTLIGFIVAIAAFAVLASIYAIYRVARKTPAAPLI
jgi:peptide/nickel transport system substrate-binding protein